MHDGVGAIDLPQPGVEGEITVRRHQIGVVIGRGDVDLVTARRLDADEGVAELHAGDDEPPLAKARITLHRTPAPLDGLPDGGGEGLEKGDVVRNG
jgi:hypothetical protein